MLCFPLCYFSRKYAKSFGKYHNVGKHPPPPPSCMSVWKSVPSLFGCNASRGLSKEYVCEHMSHLFDVPVVTMTFLFVNPNSIDTICPGHDAVP